MKNFKSTFFIITIIITSMTFVAGSDIPAISKEANITNPTKLEKDEYQKTLNDLFAKHKDLKYFTASLTQIKEGGVFKRPIKKSGTIKVKLPELFLLDMSDDGLVITVDGRYAWIYDTDLDDVEIWDIQKKNNQTKAPKLDISSFFLGCSIKTADELEKEFTIYAFNDKKSKSSHFILIPKDNNVHKFSRIELTIPKDSLLPSFVCTVGIKNGDRPPLKTIQLISSLKTNLDKAPEITNDVFEFKPNEDMSFRIMDFKGNAKEIDLEYVNNLIKSNGSK